MDLRGDDPGGQPNWSTNVGACQGSVKVRIRGVIPLILTLRVAVMGLLARSSEIRHGASA